MKWSDGPKMLNERRFHSCLYVPPTAETKGQVIIIGGSKSNATVESFDSSKTWKTIEKLPYEGFTRDFVVTNANAPEYLFYLIAGPTKEIYGLLRSNHWAILGHLSEPRSEHTTLNIPRKNIPGCKLLFF